MTLIDTGAEVSLISKKMYYNLPFRPKLSRDSANLQAVNGQSLSVMGRVNLTFKMNGLSLTHKFYVTSGLNRNFILGRDWLTENGVRLYFDLGCLRVKKTYVQLQNDIHICSLLRVDRDIVLRPQTMTINYVKLNKGFQIPDSGLVEITNMDSDCIRGEPGLQLRGSVNKAIRNRKMPVMIINQTNRHYRLKRGDVIGRAHILNNTEVAMVENQKTGLTLNSNVDDEEIRVPDEYRDDILNIVHQNIDLFAKTDSDLGHTNTISMRIDTGSSPPIKHRPYRTPLNNRKIVDKAIDEMMKAGIIERSQSSWAFPLVVVKKKDGSERMCVDFRSLNKIVKPVSFPLPLI